MFSISQPDTRQFIDTRNDILYITSKSIRTQKGITDRVGIEQVLTVNELTYLSLVHWTGRISAEQNWNTSLKNMTVQEPLPLIFNLIATDAEKINHEHDHPDWRISTFVRLTNVATPKAIYIRHVLRMLVYIFSFPDSSFLCPLI